MKRIFSPTLLISMFALTLWSCKETAPKDPETLKWWKTYEHSRLVNDHQTSIIAINHIWANDTAQLNLLDTLMDLYLFVENYESAFVIGKRVLAMRPNRVDVINKVALSAGKSGEFAIAADLYKTILGDVDEPTPIMFEIARNLIKSGQLDGAMEYLSEILNDKEGYNRTVMIREFEVPYYSAALHSIGFIEVQKGNLEMAKVAFEAAVSKAPHFGLAWDNLESVNAELRARR